METARINLTIPAPVDALIAQMATVTGQSKSSLIASILTFQMPRLRQWLDAYGRNSALIGYSLGGIDMDGPPFGTADPKRSGPARHDTSEKRSTELTRQQRRAQEREEAKEKRRGR